MIYLLRHGETLWNTQGRYQGHQDSPLTLRGLAQAQDMGRRLKKEIPRPSDFRIIASPLARTWQTAVIVSEILGLDPGQVTFDLRLREHAYGLWEGLTHEEIDARYPGQRAAREADKWNVRIPGGENYALVSDRLASWLGERREAEQLIVVSHGMAGRTLRMLYLGMPRAAIGDLREEHGTFFRLSQGEVERIEL